MSQKICTICKEKKHIDEFHNSIESISGKKAACAECSRKIQKRSINKHDGFLKNLVRTAKKNSKKRNHIFDLDTSFIFELWERQGGKCYYSCIPMITRQSSDWQCSLERIDTSIGYTKENIVLCCAELNGQFQWSLEKIETFKALYCMPHHEIVIPDFGQPIKSPTKRKEIKKKTVDGEVYWSCNVCGIFQKRNSYCKKLADGCKKCHYINTKKRMSTPRGHLLFFCTIKKKKIECFYKYKIIYKYD